MSTPIRLVWAGFLTAILSSFAVAAPDPGAPEDPMNELTSTIPTRKFQPLPGKAIGVLVSDVKAVMCREGRSGPSDALGFSRGGDSYRWVYVPVKEKPGLGTLVVPAGEKGEKTKQFHNLSLATPQTVRQLGITQPYTLVEVEVNGGLGSPAEESFVATHIQVLDGTEKFPLKVAEVMNQLHRRYEAYLQKEQKEIEATLKEAQKKALGERKPTGSRETSQLVYVAWLPETQQLRVTFQTRVSDGAYSYGRGIEPARKDGPRSQVVPDGAKPAQSQGVRFGTMFCVELGMTYKVSKTGKLERSQPEPIRVFIEEIPPPGGAAPLQQPAALPSVDGSGLPL
jgi:hypothetical protein